jgi:hypothetical protein
MIESVLKQLFHAWRQTPVVHTHDAFIEIASKTIALTKEEITERMARYNWFTGF